MQTQLAFSYPFRQAVIASRVDFRDVHFRRFEAPAGLRVESAVQQFFFSIPGPFLRLLALREFAGRRLGLKTASGKEATIEEIRRFTGAVGERIALFEVWERGTQEIVTGQRDKHLDFTLSFQLTSSGAQHCLSLETTVQVHSRLGRAYFALVKPVHRLLLPLLLRNLCRRLAQVPA